MTLEANNTCRTCLQNTENLLPICNGDDNRISEKLEYFLGNQLDFNNGLPKGICLKCFVDINHCYAFKIKCNNSLKTLKDLLDKRKNAPEESNEIKTENDIDISDGLIEDLNQLKTVPIRLQFEVNDTSIKEEPASTASITNAHMNGNNQIFRNFKKEYVVEDANSANSSEAVKYIIRELDEEEDQIQEQEKVEEDETKILHCGYCDAGFKNDMYFNSHLEKCKIITSKRWPVNEKKKHVCHICDKAFPRPCRLQNHLQKHHTIVVKPITKINNPYQCHLCDLSFKVETDFNFHMASHKQEQRTTSNPNINIEKLLLNQKHSTKVRCDECFLEFSWAAELKRHKLIHKEKQPYVCNLCSRKFAHPDNFKAHCIQVHKDERPFKCKFCGVGFGNKYRVIYHQRKHLQMSREKI